MRALFLFLTVVSILAGCHTSKKAATGNSVLSIKHGTSFGHCRGYCIKEIRFTPSTVIYNELSRDSLNFPVKEHSGDFSQAQLDELTAKIDWKKWEALDSIIGCPDCADRGAEYLIISTTSGTKKVLYDAHSTPEGLENILTLIREKRKVFEREEQNKGE
ncbi:MAG: hypothetical protein HYZ43_12700 [Flavobacteriia bacterium]|nr:hypothetical protein [Flavobacteriia bacterium]